MGTMADGNEHEETERKGPLDKNCKRWRVGDRQKTRDSVDSTYPLFILNLDSTTKTKGGGDGEQEPREGKRREGNGRLGWKLCTRVDRWYCTVQKADRGKGQGNWEQEKGCVGWGYVVGSNCRGQLPGTWWGGGPGMGVRFRSKGKEKRQGLHV